MITRRNSTKAERRLYELLKEMHIPFKYKQKVDGREIDFIIGRYAIEIDGHNQDVSKNTMLFNEGYIPIHFQNKDNIKLWLEQIFLSQKTQQ